MKCTMEGDSNEFVSIDIKQDLEAGTLELSQETCWEKAVRGTGPWGGHNAVVKK